MGSRVELFEQIRRDRDREGLSIRALAARHGVHRRAVRQALASPLPPAKRSPSSRPAPKLGAYRALIDAWLEADREAPRKQRHTAKRIWRRLVDEHGADVAETTVRDYVRARKRAMGWPVGEVFVPQVHAPGVEAEVDWGEAQVDLAGVADEGAPVLHARLVLGRGVLPGVAGRDPAGVPGAARRGVRVVRRRVRADPLRQPQLGGQAGAARAAGASRPTASSRCARTTCSSRSSPRRASQGAHEKGGVEGEVGRFRRNHLVPVPAVADLAELNALLLAGCEADLRRRIVGRPETVGEAWASERPLLRALPAEPFDATETAAPRVDAKSLVTVRQNRYSVPVGARRPEGQRPDRRARDHDQPRRQRWSRATSGCTASSAPAPSSITTSSCWRASPAASSTRWRLAQERERGAWPARVRRAVGGADRPLRALGGRAADGRRAAALPRARARPASCWPSAARSRPARTTAAPSRSSRAAPGTRSRRRRR